MTGRTGPGRRWRVEVLSPSLPEPTSNTRVFHLGGPGPGGTEIGLQGRQRQRRLRLVSLTLSPYDALRGSSSVGQGGGDTPGPSLVERPTGYGSTFDDGVPDGVGGL